jgi:hypothetical protein
MNTIEDSMAGKRVIKVQEIVNDIRSGMTDAELLVKYQLSARGLDSVFRKLLDVQAIDPNELRARSDAMEDSVAIDDQRLLVRNLVPTNVFVYEKADLGTRGVVHDITERGIGVREIETQVGELKRFLVTPDEFLQIDPFDFEATCRWTQKSPEGFVAAGFEITRIEEKGFTELRKMIHLIKSHQ